MFCLIACLFRGKQMPYKKLSGCTYLYSPNKLIRINGKLEPSVDIYRMKNVPESSSRHLAFLI